MGSASTSCGFHIKKRKEMGDKELELGSAPSLWCHLGLLWPKCKHLVLFNLMASIKLEHFLPEVSKHFVGIIYEHRKKKKKKKRRRKGRKPRGFMYQEQVAFKGQQQVVQRCFFLLKKLMPLVYQDQVKLSRKDFFIFQCD